MRIVMMGTGPFAVPTFEWLIDSQHEVPLLVTRPVPPAKSRQKTPTNPTRDVAVEHGIHVYDPADINDPSILEVARGWEADLFVVCDYGQILSSDLLAVPPLGGINLHGSLLPKYRGAAPINWAIKKGESTTGVTVIHMTPKLDAGPCLTKRETVIGDDDDAITMEERMSQVGVEAVAEAIELLGHWDRSSNIGELQDPSLACHARRLRKQDGQIKWAQSSIDISNQIRAFKPWPGSFCQWQKKKQQLRLIVDHINVLTAEELDDVPADIKPGTVIRADKERLWVKTGDAAIAIIRIQVAGKSVMPIADFLRGNAIPEGTELG